MVASSNGVQPVTLLQARYVVPIRPAAEVWEYHTVAIAAGKVLEVGPSNELELKFREAGRVRLDRHVLMPGLVNMHTHSPMSLLRGLADDLPMQDWLQKHIWPVEARWVSEDFVAAGTRLAIAEMLRSGTTCCNENYFFPEVMLEVFRESGMRVVLGLPVISLATAWSKSAEECLVKGEALFKEHRRTEGIHFAWAPHAPYTVDDESLAHLGQHSRKHGLPIHSHVLETGFDQQHSLEHFGEPVLNRLDRLGILNERTLAVHMTQLTDPEIEQLAERSVSVIHCPHSNMKLASGVCPVGKLLEAGVEVCIGTDGAASNNSLDLLAEAKTAALLAKQQQSDATCLNAWQVLEMLTLAPARALGLERSLGSLEPGKAADIVALDLDDPCTQPLHNIASQLIYAAHSRQFSHLWVAGRLLLEDGDLCTLDWAGIAAEADGWRQRLEPWTAVQGSRNTYSNAES